ncbi:MAG: RidA family protein [Pseudomonadota bacterium]
MRILILISCVLAALTCNLVSAEDHVSKSEADINFIVDDALKESGFPFSTAVEADGWVFLSGTLGTNAEMKLVEGGIEAESRQTMTNIRSVLESQGLSMKRLVKCTVMLADMAEWPAFNAVYKEFFDGTYPARSAFAASGLALGARVEVECIARR